MDLKEYAKRFEKAEKNFDKFCEDFLNKQSLQIINEAKRRSPVKTGALKASWNTTKARKRANSFETYLSNPQNYASYQEYGTARGIEARNMLSVPIQRYQKSEQARFDRAVNSYFRKEGID